MSPTELTRPHPRQVIKIMRDTYCESFASLSLVKKFNICTTSLSNINYIYNVKLATHYFLRCKDETSFVAVGGLRFFKLNNINSC